MELIDGKVTSEQIKKEIAQEVAKLIDAGERAPHMVAVLVGNDGASETYVASKEKTCQQVGISSSVYRLPENTTEKELLDIIHFLNNDEETDGFIVQLPLPKHLNVEKVIDAIDPSKDIDGFHPMNIGKMLLNQDSFLPATPFGIMELLKRSGVETVGKNCVIIGRSNIVGSPMNVLMSRNNNHANATVTMCHSKTKNMKEIAKQADILIVAMGKPNFVTEDMVKDGAVVVDVGIHRVVDESKKAGFRLVGDVDFEHVAPKCSAITPVPGGVGPMTIAGLLINTMNAYKKNKK